MLRGLTYTDDIIFEIGKARPAFAAAMQLIPQIYSCLTKQKWQKYIFKG